MLVIAFHEFGHAITACCTGGRVKSISLDPHEGGVTHMQGGISAITLPAGYLGSSTIGALLIFAGFDIVASKIASIVLGVCFLLTLWWARKDWLTIMTVLLAVGLLVACWFIAHGEALRWVVVSRNLHRTRQPSKFSRIAIRRCDVCSLQRLGYCKCKLTA
jgi:Zn-dependent protease with chaperone function